MFKSFLALADHRCCLQKCEPKSLRLSCSTHAWCVRACAASPSARARQLPRPLARAPAPADERPAREGSVVHRRSVRRVRPIAGSGVESAREGHSASAAGRAGDSSQDHLLLPEEHTWQGACCWSRPLFSLLD